MPLIAVENASTTVYVTEDGTVLVQGAGLLALALWAVAKTCARTQTYCLLNGQRYGVVDARTTANEGVSSHVVMLRQVLNVKGN